MKLYYVVLVENDVIKDVLETYEEKDEALYRAHQFLLEDYILLKETNSICVFENDKLLLDLMVFHDMDPFLPLIKILDRNGTTDPIEQYKILDKFAADGYSLAEAIEWIQKCA